MTRFLIALVALLPLAVNAASISKFSSISVAATNFQSEVVVTNGLTLGGVRNTSWPAQTNVAAANPSASLGLSAVNGTATTFLRSDGAPALSQAIVPTWSGIHNFQKEIVSQKAYQSYQGTLTHAGSMALDFDAATTVNSITLTGNVTFTTSNLGTNRTYRLRINNTQATNCVPTFPAWQFLGGAPTVLMAGKVGILTLESWAANNTNVVAAYAEVQ